MRMVELRDGSMLRKDVVDRHMRMTRSYADQYPLAMYYISSVAKEFAREGDAGIGHGHFSEAELSGHSLGVVADFHELNIKGVLNGFREVEGDEGRSKYIFSIDPMFCKIILNSMHIVENGSGKPKLKMYSPYKNPEEFVALTEPYSYSR